MKVKDVMSKNVVTIDGNATAAEAAKKMKETKLHGLIVERRNEDDAYGIISQRDIVYKVIGQGLDPNKVKVHEVMTKPCITINPNLDVKYAARLMAQTKINRAPVIYEHRLAGVISVRDILEKAL
jgi:CBS domain-containing protein